MFFEYYSKFRFTSDKVFYGDKSVTCIVCGKNKLEMVSRVFHWLKIASIGVVAAPSWEYVGKSLFLSNRNLMTELYAVIGSGFSDKQIECLNKGYRFLKGLDINLDNLSVGTTFTFHKVKITKKCPEYSKLDAYYNYSSPDCYQIGYFPLAPHFWVRADKTILESL